MYICIIFDHSPELWYKQRQILPGGFIPGPNSRLAQSEASISVIDGGRECSRICYLILMDRQLIFRLMQMILLTSLNMNDIFVHTGQERSIRLYIWSLMSLVQELFQLVLPRDLWIVSKLLFPRVWSHHVSANNVIQLILLSSELILTGCHYPSRPQPLFLVHQTKLTSRNRPEPACQLYLRHLRSQKWLCDIKLLF